jgi:hypothetical protein
MTTRITVQYYVDGRYGEMTARSKEHTPQQLVDHLHSCTKIGVAVRFLGDNGIITPTGYKGNAIKYIPSPKTLDADKAETE